jgi:hypothetical protein
VVEVSAIEGWNLTDEYFTLFWQNRHGHVTKSSQFVVRSGQVFSRLAKEGI